MLPQQPSIPRNTEKRVVYFLLVAGALFLISGLLSGLVLAAFFNLPPREVLRKVRSLTLAGQKALKGEAQGRTNFLLLGMGGAGHEGATLTDTLVLGSLDYKNKTVALLSIPRDLQVLIPGYGYRRVNSINAYSELQAKGEGARLTAQLLSTIFELPVHYYVRLDFEAFQEIVDTVGGITVTVERAFYDPFYPDRQFGYAPVAFEAGLQKMAGARALQFVRSRHGSNGEGNDFARARRQQQVTLALKERLLSFDTLLRPERLRQIWEALSGHLETNISFWETLRFAQIARRIDSGKITTAVLNAGDTGPLIERNYNGAFVLEPKNSWEEVRAVVQQSLRQNPPVQQWQESAFPMFSDKDHSVTPLEKIPRLEIQNGTFVVGLAARTAERLEHFGFQVRTIGNAPVRDLERTLVYDLTQGKQLAVFQKLKDQLDAISGEGEPLELLSGEAVDFLIVLGKNATP